MRKLYLLLAMALVAAVTFSPTAAQASANGNYSQTPYNFNCGNSLGTVEYHFRHLHDNVLQERVYGVYYRRTAGSDTVKRLVAKQADPNYSFAWETGYDGYFPLGVTQIGDLTNFTRSVVQGRAQWIFYMASGATCTLGANGAITFGRDPAA